MTNDLQDLQQPPPAPATPGGQTTQQRLFSPGSLPPAYGGSPKPEDYGEQTTQQQLSPLNPLPPAFGGSRSNVY